MFILVIRWTLRGHLLSHNHLVLIRFEQDVKVALKIEPTFLFGGVNFGKHVRVDVLEDVFESSEVLL